MMQSSAPSSKSSLFLQFFRASLLLLLLLAQQQQPAEAEYTVTEKALAKKLKEAGAFGPLFHLLLEPPTYSKYVERPLLETAVSVEALQQERPIIVKRNTTLRIIVYGAWVGEVPHTVARLNQQLYCKHWGYNYKYFYMNNTEWDRAHPGETPLWYKVYAVRDMLKQNLADYYFYFDIDCLFARYDRPLENYLDKHHRYSLYLTQSGNMLNQPDREGEKESAQVQTRFVSTHQFIVKQHQVGMNLINQWLDFLGTASCKDISGEQGAALLLLGANLYERHMSKLTREFTCAHQCASKNRRAYNHYTCALDWLEDQGFGYRTVSKLIDTTNSPPFVEHHQINLWDVSPRNSYMLREYANVSSGTWVDDAEFVRDGFGATPIHYATSFDHILHHIRPEDMPSFVHPCKKSIYSPPNKALERCLAAASAASTSTSS